MKCIRNLLLLLLFSTMLKEHVVYAGEAKGLVQLWQVVPDGQQSKEGVTTSQIIQALQCKPNHTLYPAGGVTEHETYVNSCYVDDALYLGESGDYYRIYLSGYEGKVKKEQSHYFKLDLNGDNEYVEYEIKTMAYFIPDGGTTRSITEENNQSNILNYSSDYLQKNSSTQFESRALGTVKSASYYAKESNALVHYITNNVRSSNNYSKFIVGKAPNWMEEGKRYYSYDGIYFYSRWQDIRVDGLYSINQNNPYYNYYQYLSVRSKSNYNPISIDSFTNQYIGSDTSKLNGAGIYFYNVQDQYGINGALQYAMAIHESGWGKSNLSLTKNNLFGMNAVDSNPYGSGTSFPTVEAGINYHADRYLSWGYTDPIDDSRYYGAHVGNKGSGMNVKYASDPFWGEKIAGWYYRFDESMGTKDYNYYSIGIKKNNDIYSVKNSSSLLASTLYKTYNKKSNKKIINYPFLIIGESGDQYIIKTDTPIVNGKALYSGYYDWLKTNGYISKSAIQIINHTNYKAPIKSNLKGWQEFDGIWYYFDHSGHMLTGWQEINGIWYYFNELGHMQIGWQRINGNWYYFNELGHMQIGWQEINGIWYYFEEDGKMKTHWQEINDQHYYFNELGHMQTGWQEINGIWYYFNHSGHMLTGWQEINGIWYYFEENGKMKTHWQEINDQHYYFNELGHMQTGWQEINGIRYHFNELGHMQKGWQKYENVWYYYSNQGEALTSWQTINGNDYYFNSNGIMQIGWLELAGTWYFFNEEGHQQKGWQQINNIWYHFGEEGIMKTYWQEINGIWYYFNELGHMETGWQHINGQDYYFNELGHLQIV